MRNKLLPTILAILVLVIGMACSAQDSSPKGSGYDDGTTVIPATTKILDDETRAAMLSYAKDGTLKFSRSTALLDSLAVGDHLVEGVPSKSAPVGFMRKVLGITRDGGGVTLATQNGKLNEAIDRGKFDLTRAIKQADIVSIKSKYAGVETDLKPKGSAGTAHLKTIADGYGLRVPLHHVRIPIGDGEESTASGSIEVDGVVGIDPRLHFELVIRNFAVEHYLFDAQFNTDADLSVIATGEIGVHTEREFAEIVFATVPVPAGPFILLFIPKVHLKVGAFGHITAEVDFHMTEACDLEGGAVYDAASGWTDLSHAYGTASFTSPVGRVGFHAAVYAHGDVALDLYDMSGPFIFNNAGIDVNFQTPRKPFMQLGIPVQIGVGFDLVDIPVLDYFRYSKTLFDGLIPLPSSPNSPPFATLDSPAAGTVAAGSTLHLAASVYDLEDGLVIPGMRWSTNLDGEIATGRNIDRVFYPTSPGVRSLTFTATDTDGASTAVHVDLDVPAVDPTAVIDSPTSTTTIRQGVGIALGGRASSPFRSPATDLCLAGSGFSYAWTSTLAHTGTSTGCTPAFTFTTTGTGTLSLTVTDPWGGTTTTSTAITVTPIPPTEFSIGFYAPKAKDVWNASGGLMTPAPTLSVGPTKGSSLTPSGAITYTWTASRGPSGAHLVVSKSVVGDSGTGIATFTFQPKDVPGLVLYGDVMQPIYFYVHAVDAAGNTGDSQTYVYFSWSGTPG